MEYKLKSGNILVVEQDEDAQSPNEWNDTERFLIYEHRQFFVPRLGFELKEIYNYINDTEYINVSHDNYHRYDTYDNYYIFPVEAYIHSGVSLSLFEGEKTCQFDSSVSGFIFILKDSITKIEDADELEAYKIAAQSLIDDWNLYLHGNVYEYNVFEIVKKYTIYEDQLNSIIDTESEGYPLIIPDEFKKVANISDERISIDSCGGYYANNESDAVEMILNDITEELE